MKEGKLVPNARGADVESKDGRYDGHVRRELGEIHVDVFDSAEKDNSKAHITSESYPVSNEGAREATDLLKGYGIQVEVLPRKPKGRR